MTNLGCRFARVAGYVTRIRCFLTFKLAKNGSLEVKEGENAVSSQCMLFLFSHWEMHKVASVQLQ